MQEMTVRVIHNSYSKMMERGHLSGQTVRAENHSDVIMISLMSYNYMQEKDT